MNKERDSFGGLPLTKREITRASRTRPQSQGMQHR